MFNKIGLNHSGIPAKLSPKKKKKVATPFVFRPENKSYFFSIIGITRSSHVLLLTHRGAVLFLT